MELEWSNLGFTNTFLSRWSQVPTLLLNVYILLSQTIKKAVTSYFPAF
jgi:hypothetical protein